MGVKDYTNMLRKYYRSTHSMAYVFITPVSRSGQSATSYTKVLTLGGEMLLHFSETQSTDTIYRILNSQTSVQLQPSSSFCKISVIITRKKKSLNHDLTL